MRPSLKLLVIAGCAAASLSVSAQFTAQSYDTPSYVQFSTGKIQVCPSEKKAVVTIVRSGDFRKAAAVDFATEDGTAVANVDFKASGGTVSFESGQSAKTISIPLLSDEAATEVRTFSVVLRNPGFDTVVTMQSTEVEIRPDPPSLSIELANGELIVTWNDIGMPFVLEGKTDADWASVTPTPELKDGIWLARVPANGFMTLFRLRLAAGALDQQP